MNVVKVAGKPNIQNEINKEKLLPLTENKIETMKLL